MARRKILVMPAWYPSERDPLKGIFVREQARLLAEHADVVVLHVEWAWPRPPRPIEVHDALEDGLRTVRVRVLRAPGAALLAPELLAYAAGLRRLRSDDFTPDVIHAHVFRVGFHAVALGRAIGRPVVITEHYSAFPRRLLRPWQRVVARRAFGAAEIVAPVSDDLRRHIEAYGMSGRFRVVPNMVDERVFSPSAHARRDGGPTRLLVVASLTRLKRVDHVERALREIVRRGADVHLEVAGHGPEMANCKRLARELGIADRVTFHGRCGRAEVAELMRAADLLVLASEWENMPCALLEAQLVGLPAVASEVGGVPEVIRNSSGLTFPPGDEPALADSLEAAVRDLDRFDRADISSKARARFGTAAILKQWDDVYSEAEALVPPRKRRRILPMSSR
ncbi:MAG TPA: glycosyltransferase [Thermoleophilaceae bacterium]|nr:glycosyltransferase [Thermoleophilaceae bacterium]